MPDMRHESDVKSSSKLPAKAAAVGERFSRSAAGHTWRRLNSMDFINRAMLFAAVLFLCLVPFVIVIEALAGRSAAERTIRHFGLTPQAAHDVSTVLTSPSNTSNAVTGVGYVFVALSGIAAATAIQELYERAFGVESRGLKDTPRRIVWLAVALGFAALGSWAGPRLHAAGGPVLFGFVALIALVGFWWLTMWLLLSGRISWRELFPSALATAVCWAGMSIVFKFTMSDTIVTNYKKYGAVGVVLSLMSLLIAVGVVIILGAIFGVVWRERRRLATDDESTTP